jgi:diguanylate cyclase (GGDEF)-like protein
VIHNVSNNQSSQFSDQLKRGFAGLRFSGFVEEEFLSHYAQANVQRSRLFPILAIGVTLISIGITVAEGDSHSVMLAFNFFIMLPVLGATLWASLDPARHRGYQFLLAISAVLIGMWITSIVIRASIGGAPYYFSALVAWVFSVWLILGLPFRHAAVTVLVITGLYMFGGNSWDLHLNEMIFTTAMLIFINGIGAFCCYQLEHAVRCTFLDSRVLSQLAERDGLTGLYNRRSYDEYADRIWRQSRREETQLTLMLVDIDHFKPFNDYYGHQAGDDALKEVANVIAMSAQRPLDFVARYGGEEFALILYSPAHEYGHDLPEQLRASVRDLKIPHADSPTYQYLTVSIGVAHIIPGSTRSLVGAIQMADEALYQAKAEGRNRVIVKESDSVIHTGRFRAGKKATV